MVTKGLQQLRAWAAADPARSHSTIARQIRRSQPTVSAWFAGTNTPDSASRERLKVLTGIATEDWEPAEEREFIEELGALAPKRNRRRPASSRTPRITGTNKKRARPLRAPATPLARKAKAAA